MSTPPLSFISVPERLRIQDGPLREWLYQLVRDLRVALPCVVNSFDSVKMTITARPCISEKINVTTNRVPVSTDTSLPLLLDVPILLPGAGNYVLTMPIQPGDECLVVFADMCIDSWWANGGVNQPQADKRRHDLSDGFAIMRTWSQPKVISAYSTTSAELRSLDGTVKISLSATELDITAPKVVITGATEVDIVAAGNTKIEGKNFLTHQHTGVSTGGGTSGPVL